MNCPKCNKPNRATARFCRWCGSSIATSDRRSPFEGLVDKDGLVATLTDIAAKARSKAEFCKRNGIRERMNLAFVITGDSGTGKTTVAHAIAEALFEAGVVKSATPVTVNPVDYDQWIKDASSNESKLGNSVLIVEEAQKLCPDGPADEVTQLDHILQLARRWADSGDKPVVIITGNEALRKFFNNNPQSASAIRYHLETGEISVDGLHEIALGILRDKYRRTLSPEASAKLKRILVNDKRDPQAAIGANGHDAAARAADIDLAALGCTADTVGEECVNGKEFKPKTLADVMAQFDKYVGVEEIKEKLTAIANTIQSDVEHGFEPRIEEHFRFLGNPGTGKTTMARLFAEALNALGALSVGHLVEVGAKDLVSEFVGDTPKLVDAQVRKAMGGVLFIDEAYQLTNSSHGKDAIDTLVALAENLRGKLVIILAGYTKEMDELLRLNKGLESRFRSAIFFRDYTPEELSEIFRRMVASCKEGYTLAPDADEQIGNFFKKMYMTRTGNFGNARSVRNVFDNAVQSVKTRLNADPSLPPQITLADIEGEDASEPKSIDEILAPLDSFVGMSSVKKQLRQIANTVIFDRRRMLTGRGKAKVSSYHIAITGNPGTGKTEVAKRLGQVFKALGVLPRGHVVQREKKTLLDSFANSAGANMDKAVDEALGGILFIDEAYNLIPMDNPNDRNRDGVAAVEALMTRMSNDAGKFITVIAGYKDLIDEFIANANPGLKRRFTHRIHIDDYSAAELEEILMRQVRNDNFVLTPDAAELLTKKIEEMVTMKDANFGNAGEVLKLYGEITQRMSARLGEMETVTDDQLFEITAADIPYDPPKKVDLQQCFAELDALVGLKAVKDMVHELADAIVTEQERAAAEGRRPEIPMDHYLFLGNPGTGKTTVARIMGNIFYSLGLLPSNKLLEVKPSDLIIGFVGQTAAKTRSMINRGLGGVFFIDEAYGLNDNGFGANDCTPELLTLLNDYRGRMVCIAAGYPREMAQWIATNSGLKRRFTRSIVFEDYTADELAVIFSNIASKNGMKLEAEAETEMNRYFTSLVLNKGADFGNAAEAVNYYNRAKIKQGARLRRIGEYERSELYTFRREDMI